MTTLRKGLLSASTLLNRVLALPRHTQPRYPAGTVHDEGTTAAPRAVGNLVKLAFGEYALIRYTAERLPTPADVSDVSDVIATLGDEWGDRVRIR